MDPNELISTFKEILITPPMHLSQDSHASFHSILKQSPSPLLFKLRNLLQIMRSNIPPVNYKTYSTLINSLLDTQDTLPGRISPDILEPVTEISTLTPVRHTSSSEIMEISTGTSIWALYLKRQLLEKNRVDQRQLRAVLTLKFSIKQLIVKTMSTSFEALNCSNHKRDKIRAGVVHFEKMRKNAISGVFFVMKAQIDRLKEAREIRVRNCEKILVARVRGIDKVKVQRRLQQWREVVDRVGRAQEDFNKEKANGVGRIARVFGIRWSFVMRKGCGRWVDYCKMIKENLAVDSVRKNQRIKTSVGMIFRSLRMRLLFIKKKQLDKWVAGCKQVNENIVKVSIQRIKLLKSLYNRLKSGYLSNLTHMFHLWSRNGSSKTLISSARLAKLHSLRSILTRILTSAFSKILISYALILNDSSPLVSQLHSKSSILLITSHLQASSTQMLSFAFKSFKNLSDLTKKRNRSLKLLLTYSKIRLQSIMTIFKAKLSSKRLRSAKLHLKLLKLSTCHMREYFTLLKTHDSFLLKKGFDCFVHNFYQKNIDSINKTWRWKLSNSESKWHTKIKKTCESNKLSTNLIIRLDKYISGLTRYGFHCLYKLNS